MTSHITMPKLHTSLAEVNFLYAIASGAVQRIGIFPPCSREMLQVRNRKTTGKKKLTVPRVISTHTCGVCPLRVVLQHPGQAEVGHFTLQGVVDQDVASSQITVHITHVREILHACSDATQHAHQLEGGKLTIVVLTGENVHRFISSFVIKPKSHQSRS